MGLAVPLLNKLWLNPSWTPTIIPKMQMIINGKNFATAATQEIVLAARVEKALTPIKIVIIANATKTIIQVF
jgi:hypothetical protein